MERKTRKRKRYAAFERKTGKSKKLEIVLPSILKG